MQGIRVIHKGVPGTRLLIFERARSTAGCCGKEDIAMVFYLPLIIFEAMLESQANKRKRERANGE